MGEGAFLFYRPLQALRPSGSFGGSAGLRGAGLSACRCGVPSPNISGGAEAGAGCRLLERFALRSGKSPFFFFVQIWGLLAAHRWPVVSAQFSRIDVFPVRGSPVRSCRSFFRCRSGRSLSGDPRGGACPAVFSSFPSGGGAVNRISRGGDEVTKSEYFDEYFRRFFGSFGGSENSFLCNDIDGLCTVYAGFPSISCHFLATDYTKEEFCIIGLFHCGIVDFP